MRVEAEEEGGGTTEEKKDGWGVTTIPSLHSREEFFFFFKAPLPSDHAWSSGGPSLDRCSFYLIPQCCWPAHMIE